MKKVKKAVALLLAGCAVCSTGFTAAFACTPKLDTPSISIPNITVPKFWFKSTTITDAVYMHSMVSYMPSCLYLKWNAVDGADRYGIWVTKADGTKTYYESEKNTLIQTYSNDDADSWNGATVIVFPESDEYGSGAAVAENSRKEITCAFQQKK